MKLESRPELNLLMSIAIILLGLPLLWFARDFSGFADNKFAAFVLGGFLLALGVLTLLMGETRSVELDESRRRIALTIKRRIGGSRQVIIPYQEIENFTILRQGKASNFSVYYDIGVVRKNRKVVYLFGGCAFDGRMSREWVDGVRKRFEQAVAQAQP
jgi:hypothetical protein